jgi:hypothetical protein
MTLDFWITQISILITAVGLFWGFYSYIKQSNIQIFLQYTQRYENIMDCFPEDARFYRLNSNKELPPERSELTVAVLKYINLCSEEFYLRESGQLSKKVWNIWKEELDRTLQSNLVKREWPKIKNEFISYPKFQKYTDDLINSKES